MSNKNNINSSRHTPSPSPSPSTPPLNLNHAPSKLPKFLQNKATRDRSKSVTDPGPASGSSPTTSSSSASASASPEPYHQNIVPPSKPRKTSKFLSISKDKDKGEKERRTSATPPPPPEHNNNGFTKGPANTSIDMDEPPVIVEPVNIPRPRTRSERPASSAPSESHSHAHNIPALYSSTSSTSRIGDILPTRLSGWFHQMTSASSTDLSLPALLAQQQSSSSTSSPMKGKGGGASALLTAAKHGKGHLDKAMRYLLDSDATPDKCTDPIWLLGVQHPGYEPPQPALPNVVPSSLHNNNSSTGTGVGARRSSGSPSPPSFRSSTSSIISTSADQSLSQSTNSKHNNNPAANWPPVFYIDFTSRIWLTYRSHFPSPIRDQRLADLSLCGDPFDGNGSNSSHGGGHGGGNGGNGGGNGGIMSSPATTKRPWNWGGEKTWTSDSGWGCMLRTGQSLLANALVHMHLGRDWRRPPYPVQTADYATYVQILTWFLDTPAPEAPFSVHRMALAGKELGTDVGQWFGPSVAAGAIRTLVTSFPECGLAVSVATDGTLYQSQVFAASHGDTTSRSPRRRHTTSWGDRPVLLLLGIRLGIEGVNPIYYETIKLLYTFPQSVGIAGGRPSSSYYFVGSQADNLFYLDPHNPRPAIPLRSPPPNNANNNNNDTQERQSTPDSDRDTHNRSKHAKRSSTPSSTTQHQQQHRTPASPSSTRTGSSNFSYHAPVSPSPLQHQFSNSSADSSNSTNSNAYSNISNSNSNSNYTHSRSPPPSYQQHTQHGRWRSASASQPASPRMGTTGSSEMDHRELASASAGGEGVGSSNSNSNSNSTGTGNAAGSGRGLDPVQQHYCLAYSAAELKTFHCERVRKMPLSGLDPSMLIGFLCRDEADWWDFKKRVADLPRTIFSLQDEPPTWPSDSDDNMGLESISEPDDMDLDDEGVEVDGEGESEQFFDTYSASSSASDHNNNNNNNNRSRDRSRRERGKSEEIDTEEDPVDPVTPGPNSRFDIIDRPMRKRGKSEEDDELDFLPEAGDGFGEDDDDDDEENGDGVDEEAEDVAEAEAEGDDIEDDWIDPSLPTPTLTDPPPPPPPRVPAKDPSPSPPSSSNVPPLAKGKSSSSSSSKAASTSTSGVAKPKKTKKQIPVPVPSVRLPQQQQEHYPFPVTPTDDPALSPPPPPHERARNASTKGKRMHTARARDGGRTQSGGVKGILTD